MHAIDVGADGAAPQVTIRPVPPTTFASHVAYFKPLPPGSKIGVNKTFLRQLRAILMIIIPRSVHRSHSSRPPSVNGRRRPTSRGPPSSPPSLVSRARPKAAMPRDVDDRPPYELSHHEDSPQRARRKAGREDRQRREFQHTQTLARWVGADRARPASPSLAPDRLQLISADKEGFLKGIGLWFLLAIPSTCECRSAYLGACARVATKAELSPVPLRQTPTLWYAPLLLSLPDLAAMLIISLSLPSARSYTISKASCRSRSARASLATCTTST